MLLDLLALGHRARVTAVVTAATMTLSCAPPTAVELGDTNFDDVTSIVSEAIRPSPPNTLGDQNNSTYQTASAMCNPSTPTTITLVAPTMTDVDSASIGTIQYIVWHARGAVRFDSTFPLPTINATRLKWTVDGVEDSVSLSAFLLAAIADEDPNDSPLGIMEERVSANVTTQPNGLPWSWQAINNLVNAKMEIVATSNIFSYNVYIHGAELSAEVFGQGGAAGTNAGPGNATRFRIGMDFGISAGEPVIGLERVNLEVGGPLHYDVEI